MTFDDRRRLALAVLEERGVGDWAAAPPLYRLLWRLGARLPPPHFASLSVNAALLAATILPIWFLQLVTNRHSWGWGLWECLSGAAAVGVAWALAYRRQADEHGLPPWLDVEHFEPRATGSVLGLPR